MKRVAQTYARALFTNAKEMDVLETAASETAALSDAVKSLGKELTGSSLPVSALCAIFREVLTDKVSPLSLEFLLLMLSRRQIKEFPDAVSHFRDLCGLSLEIISLRIPYALDNETLDELKTRLVDIGLVPKEAAGKAEFDITLDNGVLGGFIAGYKGYQLDASLKTAMQKIKRLEGCAN